MQKKKKKSTRIPAFHHGGGGGGGGRDDWGAMHRSPRQDGEEEEEEEASNSGSRPSFGYTFGGIRRQRRALRRPKTLSPLFGLRNEESNSCSFDAACTSADPISAGAAAETAEKLVALLAPHSSRFSCDSAQILSIIVAPLSD